MFQVQITLDGKNWLTDGQLFRLRESGRGGPLSATDYALQFASRMLGVRSVRIMNIKDQSVKEQIWETPMMDGMVPKVPDVTT